MLPQIPYPILCVALALLIYFGQSNSSTSTFIKLCCGLVRYVRKRVNAWKYLYQGADMITAGYKKFPLYAKIFEAGGKAFEIPGPDHSHIFVSSSVHISEIRKAGRDELSLFGATKQMFQPAYTMLGHNWLDERGAEGIGYVRAVGTLFPRQLRSIMPDLKRIVQSSFEDFAEANKSKMGNGALPAYQLNKKILCKLNGFCFFGDELIQNELFMDKIFEYNEMVITAAEILRVLPEFVKRIIGPYVGRHTSIQDTVFNMINDLVVRRMKENKLRETRVISSPPPSDMIQWIIETAPAQLGWDSRRITYEIIAIWFGSVHALSAVNRHICAFDLCTHPEYVTPLRTEVESTEFENFIRTTKGLPLLDSFIKESSRLNLIEAMSGRRQALKDFTFSDGTQVKQGNWTCIPAKAMLNDETYFPHANSFEGFRFAPRDKVPINAETVFQPEGPSRYSDLSENYHAWGIGGIVCPGRIYASVATKLVLAHVIKNMDCSLLDQSMNKSSIWRSYVLPREDVILKFSPRQQQRI